MRKGSQDDSAITCESKKFGVIEKIFILNDSKAIVYCREIIFLTNPFWIKNFPQLKLEFFLCKLSDQFFFEEFEKITKFFFFSSR